MNNKIYIFCCQCTKILKYMFFMNIKKSSLIINSLYFQWTWKCYFKVRAIKILFRTNPPNTMFIKIFENFSAKTPISEKIRLAFFWLANLQLTSICLFGPIFMVNLTACHHTFLAWNSTLYWLSMSISFLKQTSRKCPLKMTVDYTGRQKKCWNCSRKDRSYFQSSFSRRIQFWPQNCSSTSGFWVILT